MATLSGVDGKGIVVTGGGGGLGSAMAAEFCRLGARVVVCGRTKDTLNETVQAIEAELGPGKAFAVTVDVRDPASVAAMADEATELLGAVDGLVNNASGLFPVKAEKLTSNGFDSVIKIVLNGTWHCTSEVGRRWLEAGREGAVVNVLTPYAWMGAPGIVHNASAKGGVLAMTRTLGAEWSGRGVRVNAIAPGWMPVGGTDFLAGDPAVRQRLIDAIPAGRLLKAEETARAAAYLLSDDASYVVGEVLTIDGGHHLSKGLYEFIDELPGR
ncbi:SDR family oxidoreductase [Sphaerisporangium sp. NBC_01403]|uniref:SDR family oxidoreductase n=1 Tax=Sphaerisporangium sp. NBC_01403 TaxID=2903599 RepID=UPI00324F92B5